MISKLKNGRPERSIKTFFRMKPNVTISEDNTLKQTENPYRSITLAWWHYAIFSVIRQVRKRRLLTNEFCPPNKFDWNEQRRDREEYISIHSLVQKGIVLTMEEYFEIDLLMLEDSLAVEQILLYRAIADSITSGNEILSSNMKKMVFRSERKATTADEHDYDDHWNCNLDSNHSLTERFRHTE